MERYVVFVFTLLCIYVTFSYAEETKEMTTSESQPNIVCIGTNQNHFTAYKRMALWSSAPCSCVCFLSSAVHYYRADFLVSRQLIYCRLERMRCLSVKWRVIIAVNFPIWAIGKKKPEKIRASTGFEPVTSWKKNQGFNCDDHSHFIYKPQYKIWIISYILHMLVSVDGI